MLNNMATQQSKLILEHYLNYQRSMERQMTLREFSIFLGIHETTLNLLINDKREISGRMAVHLASKTNDNRFLDLKRIPHQDPLFSYVSNEWSKLKPEQKKAIRDQIEIYLNDVIEDAKKATT